MLAEELAVKERQLDGVAYLFYLSGKASDVFIGDVRNLLENQLLDLRLRQSLDGEPRLRVHEQAVPRSENPLLQGLGQLDHALLIGAGDYQRALAILEHLFDGNDLTVDLEVERVDHVESFVQHDLVAPLQIG